MSKGYIYCLSNCGMPGLVKIGFTADSTPLEWSSQLYTTGVPYPFQIEFSKYVKDPDKKERLIHAILGERGERVNPSREFFSTNISQVRMLFDLIDGLEEAVSTTPLSQSPKIHQEPVRKIVPSLDKILKDGTRVRHCIITLGKQLVGIYEFRTNCIVVSENDRYPTLRDFASAHYDRIGQPKKRIVNPWKDIQVLEEGGRWNYIETLFSQT